MSVPFTTAEMAAATRRYGYPRGSEFDDGVRVGPTFPGFVSNEVAANLSMAGIPDIQKNCPPLDDCQTVMGYGALLAPIYSYNITVNSANDAPEAAVTTGNNNTYPTAFVSVSTFPDNILNNAITSSGTVTLGAKSYRSWDFDWPRTVNLNIAANAAIGSVSVHGVDMYNQPMTETILVPGGNDADSFAYGRKAFKSVIGVTGGGGNAGEVVSISPSLTTFGLPYYTTTVINPTAGDAVLNLPVTPYTMTDPTVAANWTADGTDVIYTPVTATASGNTGVDVRGTVELNAVLTSPTDIIVLAYCLGFDGFIKQQIINKSPYGRYQVPVGLPGAGSWVTVPTPAWLISPQTQYGVKQYWGNPAI